MLVIVEIVAASLRRNKNYVE